MLSSDDFYRILHTGNPGDVEFYERCVSGAQSALELGCGFGRITDALSRVVSDVVGLDTEPQKFPQGAPAGQYIHGDMRTFALARTFDRILIPYNSIYCLGGIAGLRGCLAQAARHLNPKGELWFDCYPMDDFHEASLAGDIPPDEDEEVLAFKHEGQSLRVIENTEIDPAQQRLVVRYRALSSDNQVAAEQEIVHNYLLASEIHEALEGCGFQVDLLAGGFDGRPYGDEASQLIFGASLTAN